MKVAFITGVTGQDGAYLSEFLLKKGYQVHGMKRRSSSFNTDRIDHLYQDPHVQNRNFFLHYGDMTDSTNITRLIKEIQPDEIYNLAAMSHVAVSFETPEYTGNADGLGTLRILDAVRLLGLENKTRIYQASTSVGLKYFESMDKTSVPAFIWYLGFLQDLTNAFSLTPLPIKSNSIPTSSKLILTKSRTEVVLPVAIAKEVLEKGQFYRHIGIYGYRKDFLLKFVNMEQSYLEKVEKLEQLRALENGFKIKMIEANSSLMGIDTREDYEEALKKYWVHKIVINSISSH